MNAFRLSDFKDLIAAMPTAYHSSRAKSDKKWKSVLDRSDAAGAALRSIFNNQSEVTISRSNLRSMAKEAGLERFVMATLLWGYPNGMQGNHVRNICTKLGSLVAILSDARSQPLTDWKEHYQQVEKIKGVGLSTYTKFLTFLPANVCGYTALILDSRIISVGKLGVFAEFAGKFSERKYPAYLERMHQIANGLGVSAENLEFFLFLFGPDLKQTEENLTVAT